MVVSSPPGRSETQWQAVIGRCTNSIRSFHEGRHALLGEIRHVEKQIRTDPFRVLLILLGPKTDGYLTEGYLLQTSIAEPAVREPAVRTGHGRLPGGPGQRTCLDSRSGRPWWTEERVKKGQPTRVSGYGGFNPQPFCV